MSHQRGSSSQHPNHPVPQHPPANQAGRGSGGQRGGSPSNSSPSGGNYNSTERSNENPDGSHTFVTQWQRQSEAQPNAHLRSTWEAWMAARNSRQQQQQTQGQQRHVPVGAVQGQAQPNAPPPANAGPSQTTPGPAMNQLGGSNQNHAGQGRGRGYDASAASNLQPSQGSVQTPQAPDQPTGSNQNNGNPPT